MGGVLDVKKWILNLSFYFKTLYDTNKQIIELTGMSIDDSVRFRILFLEISKNLMRLIPCQSQNGSLKLKKKDGLLEFANEPELDFLKADYDELFNQNFQSITAIKNIRNKFEHSPHKLEIVSYGSGGGDNHIVFKIDQSEHELNVNELISTVKPLNKIFDKIIQKMQEHRSYLDERERSHPYFEKHCALSYERFNRLLDSRLLYDISRIMPDFW